MDKSIVVVEGSHWRSDSVASASKPLGSLVQIDSIAIDLSCAMEEIEAPVHEHFSIRGFVAGVRKQNPTMCLPFASEGSGGDDDLPPLSVPKYRWWQCSTCVPEISAEWTTPELMLLADRSDPGTSSCPHVGGEKDDLFFHSIQNIGDEHSSKETINGEDSDPSNKMIIYNPLCSEGLKGTTCSKQKTDVRNTKGGNSRAYITKANQHNNNTDASDIVRTAENPILRLDEPENVSSGSDDACGALLLRRKPKLRSLADIMDGENNSTGESNRTRSASSSGIQIRSPVKEADLDPQIQLGAHVDAATVPRSPHTKRKTSAVEVDRVPLETTLTVGTTKRLKDPISDLEKKCRVVEVSDSESGRDRSKRSDLQLSAKTQQIKFKRNKALVTSRKMKHTKIDKRTCPVREVPKRNAVHSANLHKRVVPSGTKCGDTGHIPLTLRGETATYFDSFISGKQVDRISDPSRSKKHEVEADHSPIIPPKKKSFLGDYSIQGKVALNLSLNSYTAAERNSNNQTSYRHRGIPDLNESFTEKPSMTQGKQLPTLFEDMSSTVHKNLDTCEQIAREGKRPQGVSDPQAVQEIPNNVEHGGTSDDIPMEIVELLAMNQRERALENSRNHLLPESINNSIGGSPVCMEGHSGMINFSFTNARSGINVEGCKIGIDQGIMNFPPTKNCQLDIGHQDESQFRLFSSFKPSPQKKLPYSASNSVMLGPRPTEGPDLLLWPPRRKNVPIHLDVRQNRSVQPNGSGMRSISDQRFKGKTVSDMKGEERRAARDASAVKEGRIGSSAKSAGSLDAYSNDTIPAMQLLSLMDRGFVSGSSFKVGPNSFLDKPFSPCNHHPRLNGNEKQNDPFLSASFFSQSSHTKDFPALKRSYTKGQMPPHPGNTKAFHFGGPSNLVNQPSGGNPASEVCTLNRNPADFSIPDAKNEFTITAKDLKSRKRKSLKERNRSVNVDGQKRQKARKYASAKELPRK